MKTFLKVFFALPLVLVAVLIGFFIWKNVGPNRQATVRNISGQPFLTSAINGMTVKFYTSGGQLRAVGNDVFIEFQDASGALVDVGDVKFELDLSMKGAVMHTTPRVQKTATPGQYRAQVMPQIAGEWLVKLSFAGAHGNSETQFTVPVK